MANLIVPGGHSGAGMLAINECSNAGLYTCYTAVSKQGRPAPGGPSLAMWEAMQQKTQIYHAKCDTTDAKAFNDLLEWTPIDAQVARPQTEIALKLDEIVNILKSCSKNGSARMLRSYINTAEDCLATCRHMVKQAKRKQGQDEFKAQHSRLKAVEEEMEEKEAELTEIIADLWSAVNARKESGVDESLIEESEQDEFSVAMEAKIAAYKAAKTSV